MARVLIADDSVTLRTILRIAVEKRGHHATLAVDGADALDRMQREHFDLVLLDFVMPRLNGYQVAQAMRSIRSLRTTPVVLVSAKADQIGERFMSQTGAQTTLQKPFTPQQLQDVLAQYLVTASDPLEGLATDLETPLPASALTHSQIKGSRPHTHDSVTRVATPKRMREIEASERVGAHFEAQPLIETTAHERFTTLLAHDLTQAFQDMASQRTDVTEETVKQLLKFYLSSTQVRALYRELVPFAEEMHNPVALHGLIEQISLSEIFQLLALQRQTGILHVERLDAPATITFALHEGKIDQAFGHHLGDEFRIGRYLLACARVSRAHIESVASSIRDQRLLLGDALVTGGFLRPEERNQALELQTSELTYEVLRWGHGRFRFEAQATHPAAQQAALGLHSDVLVMEAVRRLDEWQRMGEILASESVVLRRMESGVSSLPRHEMHRDQLRVLDAIDGHRTIREIVMFLEMSSFETYKILQQLLKTRFVAPSAA
jgi:CheY-like chemotaxis protein